MKHSPPTLNTSSMRKTLLMFSLVLMCTLASTAQTRWNAINVGLSNPTAAFYQNNLTLPFEKAVGAKPGWFASFEGAYYFSEGGKVSLGASYLVSMASNGTNWNKWVAGSTAYTSTNITS